MSNKSFDQLIQDYLAGKASPEEKRLIHEWLDALDENPGIEEALNVDQRQALKLKIQSQIRSKTHNDGKSRTIYMNGRLAIFTKIAASILLVMGSIYFYQHMPSVLEPQQVVKYNTSTSEINKEILPDGSIVWLKGKSKISYPGEFQASYRELHLEGEALFEIAKDPERPFYIYCEDMTAKVLGTSFNIKSSAENVEIAVLTGKVEISSAKTKTKTLVKPNETGQYSRSTRQIKKVVSNEADNFALGTEYDMNFTNKYLPAILRQLENKFDVSIKVKNDEIFKCLLTADLTDQSLANSIEMMCAALSLEYEMQDGLVILDGKGCM